MGLVARPLVVPAVRLPEVGVATLRPDNPPAVPPRVVRRRVASAALAALAAVASVPPPSP